MAKDKGPAYQVIYRAILKKINKGEYDRETAIPSENELAAKYGVSRMTARKSVDMLVAEGYLFRQKGRGTYITGRRNLVRDDLSLTARLDGQGQRVYSEVREFAVTCDLPALFGSPGDTEGPVPAEPQAGPDSPAPAEYWKIERLRFVDDRPAILERVWIPQNLAPDLTEAAAGRSLAAFLGQTLELGTLELGAAPALLDKKKPARALGLKKDALVLAVTGTLSLMDGTPCLYAQSWQNTAVLPFTLKLIR